MAKYRLNFYSIKKKADEIVYFENRTDFEALKSCLLRLEYIKDLKAYKFDSKSKMYWEIKL